MKIEFSQQIFEKSINVKFHQNVSSGSRVPHGQTDKLTNGRTDMTKPIVAFRNFVDAPNERGFPFPCHEDIWRE